LRDAYLGVICQTKEIKKNELEKRDIELENLVGNLLQMLPNHFITLLSFLLTFIVILSSISSICIDNSNAVTEQEETSLGAPIAIVPAITQNLLTEVSFFVATSSFILGLRIQSAARTTSSTSQSSSPQPSIIDKYFELLILALIIPALIIIIYGIVLIGSHVYKGNISYLILLFALFVPVGAILFLVKKLRTSR
jgi:hypothetical protein